MSFFPSEKLPPCTSNAYTRHTEHWCGYSPGTPTPHLTTNERLSSSDFSQNESVKPCHALKFINAWLGIFVVSIDSSRLASDWGFASLLPENIHCRLVTPCCLAMGNMVEKNKSCVQNERLSLESSSTQFPKWSLFGLLLTLGTVNVCISFISCLICNKVQVGGHIYFRTMSLISIATVLQCQLPAIVLSKGKFWM